LGFPRFQWPAVVGFDNLPVAEGQILTSLHRPDDLFGRTAADLLVDRRQGRLTGPPVLRRVPMILLPRLTSRTGWSASLDAGPLLPTVSRPAG
jgi:DNA-binding LacI/PurR family transcriptional regulator